MFVLPPETRFRGKIMRFRPFHETIVEILPKTSRDQFKMLGLLISATKVPKEGRDAVNAAWIKQAEILGLWPHEYLYVSDSLWEQTKEETLEEMTHQEMVEETLDRR